MKQTTYLYGNFPAYSKKHYHQLEKIYVRLGAHYERYLRFNSRYDFAWFG